MSARLHPVVSSRAAPADARAGGAHLRDALIVAAITIATAALCAHFNVTEKLRHLTAPYEWLQLDELPSVVVVLAVSMAWFAARRYREARWEIARRTAVEAKLAASLANNRRLAQQYVELQEAQRKSLARELHDELGQYLNVIKLDAVGIRDDRPADPAAVHARARAIVEHCNHIHGALATLLRELRPVGLDELGLEAALEHCVDAWRARLPDVMLDLSVTGDFTTLPEGLAVTVYRLVQEALTNVATHAAAHRVVVRLDRAGSGAAPGETVTVAVEDDGVGTEPELPTRGLGLIGMRERVMALQGELVFKSSPGRGFQLTARIPVQPAAEDGAS
ncbi:MAG: ATP-binding protein [Steroidobacteraceae bacterium]